VFTTLHPPRTAAGPGGESRQARAERAHGEFPWHHHDEDELFLCWEGELRAGDLFSVPRGIKYRPVAADRAIVLLLERPETKQYGN
jgi:quercetin dioxygenase-like cupin family protein